MAKHGLEPELGDPDDKGILSKMLSFGIQGCEEAIEKWSSGKYTQGMDAFESHAIISENYWRWTRIKNRMKELAKRMRGSL